MSINNPISEMKGIGEALSKKLAILGVETVENLINFYPRRYEDYSTITKITDIKPGPVTIQAEIKQAKGRYVQSGLHITEAVASDQSGSVRLVWFNQPYRAKGLKSNSQYFISGQFDLSHQRLVIMNPSVELVGEFPANTARILPIYKQTKGLTSKQIRKVVREIVPEIKRLPETLPNWLVDDNKLISRAEATLSIHFPTSAEALEKARRRLGFEEVFCLSLASQLVKQRLAVETAPVIKFNESLAKDFVAKLPFKLTDDQRKVAWQIFLDLQQPQPMNRLVEGDVGSGKTVVAAMAAVMAMSSGAPRDAHLAAVQGSKEERRRTSGTVIEQLTQPDAAMRQESDWNAGLASRQDQALCGSGQVALMAPTEILAKQHADTLMKILAPIGLEERLSLLVGSQSAKQKTVIRKRLASGDCQFVVGTHALISEGVDFTKLSLVIIDEQHRFGVGQRQKLQKKAGHAVHTLNLTATPIPRSLALVVYGELEVSVIAQKPPGRNPILTKIVSPNSKSQVYSKVKQELDAGRQMFVVCPLISESDTLNVSSAEKIYEQFSKIDFKSYKVGLLTGQMKSEEKDMVMADFVSGKIDILVATTVVEVGVDVPNATVMMIESPERFGLAQIHQLRGRVGRGEHTGYCYLMMSDSKAPSQRLRALESVSDGFKLAEIDLEMRGPGAIYGQMQHGQLDLRIANLSDTKLIMAAKSSAKDFIRRNENLLKYTELNNKIEQLYAITNLN